MSEIHNPTDKTRGKVEALTSAGYNQQAIADYLEVSVATLRKYYRKELTQGKMDKVARVTEKLYSIAMFDGKPTTAQTTACIFYLKCRGPKGEWVDNNANSTEKEIKEISKIEIQVVGQDGKAIEKPKAVTEDQDETTIQ